MGAHEIILTESKKNISFAYPTIPNDQKFGQIIIPCIFFHFLSELLNKLNLIIIKWKGEAFEIYFISYFLFRVLMLLWLGFKNGASVEVSSEKEI